jgi:pimeloyl-ACP methyl ester carboxylesterase
MVKNDGINESQVAWQVDDMQVSASLTRPQGEGPFPALVMVAGSGPTDRDWNTPLLPGTNGSAALLAGAITGIGFITLRYDKRASGPHARENMPRLAGKVSMQSHVDELAGGMRFLASRADVDARRLFILTNSEGALHALNYHTQQLEPDVAGLVLTSSLARPGGVLAHEQVAAQLAAVPGGQEMLAAYDAAIADFVAGRPVKVDESLPEGLRMMLSAVSTPMNQPFARELWTLDPADLLGKVHAPTLAVFGKKDIQVDWQKDGAVFESVAKKRNNIQVAYLENANHVLKFEPRPRSELDAAEVTSGYNAETAQLDPETVDTIQGWLKDHI